MSVSESKPNSMNSRELELSTLVGREILIQSAEIQSNSLYSKVVMVHGNSIAIDKGGDDPGLVAIQNKQNIIVQFDYKGQRVSAKAKLFRTQGGRSTIILDEQVIPLSRRMFKRYNIHCNVRCAILPTQRIIESNISKLRWLQVEAVNISSGGILLPIPSKITDKTFLLVNIGLENPILPNLLISQVKHSSTVNNFNYLVGLQFIINEKKEEYFSDLVIKKLPPKTLEYTIKKRNQFDKFLLENLSLIQE